MIPAKMITQTINLLKPQLNEKAITAVGQRRITNRLQ